MSLMTWNQEYSVGVRLLDQQHKRLFELLNELYEGLRQQRGMEVLGSVLFEMIKYTEIHFATEERLMQQHGFAGLEAHKLEHLVLTKKVREFQAEFQSGKATTPINVLQFLRHWLENHILGTDKKYSSFFGTKGVR
ncbi:MAG TPA: bacteriohemerythrin [Bacteroidota bacterium]|nr:bacteriohemerythrin [Bacteroidota bacterium]